MRWTIALQQAARAAHNERRRSIKSLALSVHFKQPDFGMKDYEILSRATCYLLGIDPPETPQNDDTSPYAHLEAAQKKRELKEYKHQHKYSPASGDADRDLRDFRWLEFVPREVRPQVHVVCSSHVVSPFLWRDYYPQDWLTKVKQEHCVYSLEVYDPDKSDQALLKIALNPEPFHHPEGRDLALVHFKEESSLRLLKKLGVDVLYFRNPDKLFQKGETMSFDGYVVTERNTADGQEFKQQPDDEVNEDLRVFYPYKETGNLSFHTDDRFFATTPKPLPEGLCGAPVLDLDGDLCGTVEGIVPVDHKNKNLAGSAAFIPSYVMQVFVDYVERGLLEKMMPPDLFQMVVAAKKTNSLGGAALKADGTQVRDMDEAYELSIQKLKERYDPEEAESILEMVRTERDEVLRIMNEEGGEMDEIIKQVRLQTMQIRTLIREQYGSELPPSSDEADTKLEKSS